jgi:hypothetical protein
MGTMDKMDDNIEDDSLITDKLTDIIRAMQKIKPIDRSEYFNKYYNEISKAWIEKQLKAMEPGNQVKGSLGEPIKD